MNDWRLTGQDEYMKNVELIEYSPNQIETKSDDWHEHCEFCMKELNNKYNEICYSTKDNYRWICQKCYSDFKSSFNWKITNK